MKSAYIAIAVLAMIAAVVLLSGCTSGPATNATPNATLKPTKAPTSMPATSVGSVDSSAGVASALNATQWPEIRSGNNTSIINTSAGMREVPNSMLAGANNTTASVAPLPTTPPA